MTQMYCRQLIDTGFPNQFNYSALLLHIFTFSLEIKIKMCKMYTVFHIYFENIQYYFAEFNMVQKLKNTNKVLTNFIFGQNKIRTEVHKT